MFKRFLLNLTRAGRNSKLLALVRKSTEFMVEILHVTGRSFFSASRVALSFVMIQYHQEKESQQRIWKQFGFKKELSSSALKRKLFKIEKKTHTKVNETG